MLRPLKKKWIKSHEDPMNCLFYFIFNDCSHNLFRELLFDFPCTLQTTLVYIAVIRDASFAHKGNYVGYSWYIEKRRINGVVTFLAEKLKML